MNMTPEALVLLTSWDYFTRHERSMLIAAARGYAEDREKTPNPTINENDLTQAHRDFDLDFAASMRSAQ